MKRAVISGDRNEALRYLSPDVIYRIEARDPVARIVAIFAFVAEQSRVPFGTATP